MFAHSFVLGILVPEAIVRHDVEQLRGDCLARSWPDSSLWSAVVVFGPLCVPIHFMRTRRSLWGVMLGLLWLAGAVLLITLPVEALAGIFGVAD